MPELIGHPDNGAFRGLLCRLMNGQQDPSWLLPRITVSCQRGQTVQLEWELGRTPLKGQVRAGGTEQFLDIVLVTGVLRRCEHPLDIAKKPPTVGGTIHRSNRATPVAARLLAGSTVPRSTNKGTERGQFLA